MSKPSKAFVAALLIAIPAPLVLGYLLVGITPELFQILSQTETSPEASNPSFVLGSAQGIVAYLITVALFTLAGFITVLTAQKGHSKAPQANPSPRQQNSSHSAQPQDETQDENFGPEGSEEGSVKWFNVKKGFGFIIREDGDEIFVHFRAIRGHGRRVLRQGQLVRFDVVDADKGLQADNVSILSD